MTALLHPSLTRRPRRVSITVADSIYQQLLERSDYQGRSLSNLASYLLEQALEQLKADGASVPVDMRWGTSPETRR